jgi:thiamine kinase-like enzyme
MWNEDVPTIIDWESAGFVNPMHDLVESAIYWSKDGLGSLDQVRFTAFMEAYRQKCGSLNTDWKIVLTNGFKGKLAWLEYNLKRSIWMECADDQEQKLGTAQVKDTLRDIKNYAMAIPLLEEWIISAMGE